MKDQFEFYLSKIKLFLKNILYSFYSTRSSEMKNIISINRKFLNSIDEFVNEEIYTKNNYGISPNIFQNINKPINNSITYSDLINFLILKIFNKNVNYFETGVSVMKNILQVDNFIKKSTLYAYEIEEINKIFSSKFQSDIDNFHISKGSNNFYYFHGDIGSKVDNKRFNHLIGNLKFDFVFSDAHHQPWSLIWEYKNVIKNNLAEEFIIYFDDIDFPGIEDVVIDILNDLNNGSKKIFGVSFYVNGWIGQYEKFHKNAIISTFDIKKILNDEKIKIPFIENL